MNIFRRPWLSRSCVVCVTIAAITFFTVDTIYRITRRYDTFHWINDPKADFHWLNEPQSITDFHWTNYSKTSGRSGIKEDDHADYITYTNHVRDETFKVRISLSSEEQFDLVKRLNTTGDLDIFIPTKRVWSSDEKFTFEWDQLDLLSKVRPVMLNTTRSPCWYNVHGVLRCLPYMYLIGAPKCGTTDLYKRLLQHPDFTEPAQKEPHWISRQRIGKHNSSDYDDDESRPKKKARFSDYLSQFQRLALKITGEHKEYKESGTMNPRITGDCSASTLWDNDIWTQLPRNDDPLEPKYTNPHYVYKLNPKAKIIVILRDPVERLFSDYLYFLPGAIHKSQALFHNQVLKSINLFTSCLKTSSLRSCVYNPQLNQLIPLRLRIGIYYIYLREWYEVFPSDQILVLQTEKYAKSTSKTVQRVYKFLGLDPLNEEYLRSITRSTKKNARKLSDESIGEMWSETRKLLKSFYSTFDQLLQTFIKDHVS